MSNGNGGIDFNFGIFDFVAKYLKKYKKQLGPFYRPLELLLAAALFIAFLALLIGAPIWWLNDFVYIGMLQIVLVAAFFMLLLSISMDVYDRFVFCMALFLVLTAAPIMVTVSHFLGLMEEAGPVAFEDTLQDAKLEVFMYALMRGFAQMSWSLPLLFLFFTFFPRLKEKGAAVIESRLKISVIAALILQGIAAGLHVWLGGTSKAFKSTQGAAEAIAAEISKYQMGFLSFQVLYIALGFFTIFAVWKWFNGDDNRSLAIVVTGMLAVQGAYMISSFNNRQLILHYPSSRTAAKYVETRRSDTGQFVFTIARPNTISKTRFQGFRAYAICTAPNSGQFTLRIQDTDSFLVDYKLDNLANVPSEEKFCQQLEGE